jgi:hypothetical protein
MYPVLINVMLVKTRSVQINERENSAYVEQKERSKVGSSGWRTSSSDLKSLVVCLPSVSGPYLYRIAFIDMFL